MLVNVYVYFYNNYNIYVLLTIIIIVTIIIYFAIEGMRSSTGTLRQRKKWPLLHLDVSLLWGGGGGGVTWCVYVCACVCAYT